jgi:hypothetical protein
MMEIKTSLHLGWLIAILTFPGVIIHEWAHKFFCDRANVKVYKTCYFRPGNPAGYVVHGPIRSYWQALLIDTAPFIINTLIAFFLFLVAGTVPPGIAKYLLYWLGISIAMHSFPSAGDAGNLWRHSKQALKKNPLVIFFLPVVGLVKLAQMLSIIWFHLLYAVALLLLAAFLLKGELLF